MKSGRILTLVKFLLITGLAYLLFLTLFFVKSLPLYTEGKNFYKQLAKVGFTSKEQIQYRQLLTKTDEFQKVVTGPLISPLTPFTGHKEEIDRALFLYQQAKAALPIVPKLLGYEKPQRYFIAFQNPAEARGTGGIIGAYAVVSVSKSKFTIEKIGSNVELQSLNQLPVSMPAEFEDLYGSDPAIWQNSNISPHFPYGAKIWLELWKRQSGEALDGVIALDPFVLSQILEVTGPIAVNDEEVSSTNVVYKTLSEAYSRFENDNLARKQYLVSIIRGVAEKLISNHLRLSELLKLLTSPEFQNRIYFYSSDATLQRHIEQTRYSGSLSENKNNQYRLVVQNISGNKMDYYLQRNVILKSKTCGRKRISSVEIEITNTAQLSQRLPSYVKGRLDIGLPSGKGNSTAITALMYGPVGAKILTAIDPSSGLSIGYVKSERGHEILVAPMELAAGQGKKVIVEFQGGVGKLESFEQPLVIPQKTTIVDSCKS